MFDIGFWELIIIGVVALLVVGPERFPGMVKKTGHYVGQFRRIAASVKSEISLEVDKAEQLQELLEEQKQILKRSAEADLTQPAVKRKTPEEKELASESSEAKLAGPGLAGPELNEPALDGSKPDTSNLEKLTSKQNKAAEEKS